MADGILIPCNVACGSGIVTVNSLSASTLQCDTWLWDDMPLNSRKRPPYWNSTSGFDFDHIIAAGMSFCTSLRNYIQIGPPSAEKNDVMSIFKITDLRHLGFYGSNNGFFEKPMYANSQCSPCRSSIDTIALNCLVFEKIAFFAFWRQTDRQSDKQTDSTDPLSRSRYRERRFNKQICRVYGCCE